MAKFPTNNSSNRRAYCKDRFAGNYGYIKLRVRQDYNFKKVRYAYYECIIAYFCKILDFITKKSYNQKNKKGEKYYEKST